MRHIKTYPTSGAVQTALDQEELGKPYIAFVEDGRYIDWNTKSVTPPLSAQPLTFEIISAGTIMWTANRSSFGWVPLELHFSKNGGAWETILSSSAGTPINVEAGDEIRFKGNGITDTEIADRRSSFNGSTCWFNVRGNIASICYENNFQNVTTGENHKRVWYLFQNTNVVDASKLVIPYTNFEMNSFLHGMFKGCTKLVAAPEIPEMTFGRAPNDDSACANMFQGCTSLERAPILRTTSVSGAGNWTFYYMFDDCTKLNYVECLTEDTSGFYTFDTWLRNVSSTGTFVKHPNATWPSGDSGIPEGWTVVDAEL